MELDELKSQLKNKLATDHTGRSDADIAALLNKRTGSIVGKLKKSLWFEIWLCVLVIVVFSYIGITSQSNAFRIYFSVFAVFTVGTLLLLIYLLRRTTQLSSSALPVKRNLQTIVHIIDEFVKRYFQLTMILIPVCFVFSLLLGFNERQHMPGPGFGHRFFSSVTQAVIFLAVYIGALTVGVYYFTKYYLQKLYGKYVTQLKECIRDLSEE